MSWDVEVTDECRDWYRDLDESRQDALDAAVQQLEEKGPSLGRPVVGEIALEPDYRQFATLFGRHLKELRPTGSVRVLFIFDPRRTAILLLGGDKRGDWSRWYREAIPIAAKLYETYLADIKDEGLL
jgi:hypothetical protein